MAQYNTVTKVVGDITVTVSKAKSTNAADRLEAFLKWLGTKVVDPGYGVDVGLKPDQGLPGGGGAPDQGLPGSQPGVDNTLPGSQPGVDNTLPGSPGSPDQSLPGAPGTPDQGLPGSQPGVDNTLPGGQGGTPDQSLPGNQPGIDNGLPGFIAANAKEIAKAILKGTACDPEKPQPK